MLRLLRNYVLNYIIAWLSYLKNKFTPDDFLIRNIRIFCKIDEDKLDEDADPLWDDLQIDDETGWLYHPVDKIKTLDEVIEKAPSFVSDIHIQTSFWFRGEKKTYIGTDATWPPRECVGRKPTFTLPIKSAHLVTLDETEDVTSRVVKFSGPYGDFYGKPVQPRRMFLKWEPTELNKYDFLEIIDILGFKKEFPID